VVILAWRSIDGVVFLAPLDFIFFTGLGLGDDCIPGIAAMEMLSQVSAIRSVVVLPMMAGWPGSVVSTVGVLATTTELPIAVIVAVLLGLVLDHGSAILLASSSVKS